MTDLGCVIRHSPRPVCVTRQHAAMQSSSRILSTSMHTISSSFQKEEQFGASPQAWEVLVVVGSCGVCKAQGRHPTVWNVHTGFKTWSLALSGLSTPTFSPNISFCRRGIFGKNALQHALSHLSKGCSGNCIHVTPAAWMPADTEIHRKPRGRHECHICVAACYASAL